MKVDLQDFKEDDPACRFMTSIKASLKANGVETQVHVDAREHKLHGHVHDYNQEGH
jgi:hypothetical protein